MEFLNIGKDEKICIVAPHPDDESIGCGGLMALYPKNIDVILLSDGRYGIEKMPPEEIIKIRKEEFKKVMKKAKIENFYFMDYPNGGLMNDLTSLYSIDFKKYTKVFVTSTKDFHYDHTAAALAVIEAIKKQKCENIEIYFYAVHTPIKKPTTFMDITSVIDKKIQFIRTYESQRTNLKYSVMIKHLAEYRAASLNMFGRYLEEYVKININDLQVDVEEEKKLQIQELFGRIYKRWLEISASNKTIYKKIPKNVKNIVVYGYGKLGKILLKDLLKNGYKVPYVLDQRADELECSEAKIIKPVENLRNIDLIIVTLLFDYDGIREFLNNLGYENIEYLKAMIESINI